MAHVEFPQALFQHLRSQSCILCTGVRFSKAAGLPDWEELLEKLSSRLSEEDRAEGEVDEAQRPLSRASYLARKLGAEACAEALREAYGEPEAPRELPEAFRRLREIPFQGAISTSYDSLLEQALTHNGTAPRVFTYADGATLRLAAQLKDYVLKAHGDVKRKVPLVLSVVDFKRAISPNKAYRAFVEELYRTQTLLLLGFRRTDPDFDLFLDRLLGSFPEAASDHYAILPGVSEAEAEELYTNYRLRVISYEEGDDPVAALGEVLEALYEAWGSKGEELPGPDAPEQRAAWLRQQLAPVDTRLDVMDGEGLALSDGRMEAIRKAAKDVDLDLLDGATLCRLGNVHIQLEDLPQGLVCYEKALEQDEAVAAVAHLNLHHACAESGKFDEAIDHLSVALEKDPSLRVIPERFELQAVHGRGTTGTIYRARDTEAKRDVMVKVLRTSYVREHVSPALWLRETERLQELTHAHICRVHEALIEGGRCLLVTERVKGKSLSALLREKETLKPEAAARLLKQVCDGLQHAHAQGILHLDITPSNILIREDDTAVIMDFRTGRAQKGRRVSVKRGGEGFQAPELLAGAGGDARADVYSLGAILYHMVTGKVPVGSFPRAGELVSAARRFDAIIGRSLRAQPEDRPQTVEAFAATLESSGEDVVLPESADDLAGWLEVLSFQPDHSEALEKLTQLEARYETDKEWDSLVTLLLGRVEVQTEARDREATLRKVARIFEQEVGDLAKAFAALLAALREDSANVATRKELERLAGATGMWNDLLQEYNNQVQSITDPAVKGDWLVRLGRLYANELRYDDYALASYNQALALDGGRTDALNEKADVLRRKEDYKELAKVLRKLLEAEEDEARQLELLQELAQLSLRELEDEAGAVEAYRRMLQVSPGHSAALKALQGLYRKAERFEDLAGLLREALEHAEEAEDLRAYRHDLAGVLAEQLDKAEEAIAQYQALVEADPDDHAALRGLEKLFDATGRNDEYMAILDKRIAAAETDAEKVELCQRMAATWEDQEGGQARAAEYLEKVVEINGGDEETFKTLVRYYWAVPDHAKLAGAYRSQIELTKKADDRIPLYMGLGKVFEEHLQDSDMALATFLDLKKDAPGNKMALYALARIYGATERWAEAVEVLKEISSTEEDLGAQADAFQRIGAIQFQQLGDEEEAEINLVKALELKEHHTEAHLSLAELYRGKKDYGKAARNLVEAARHTPNTLERVKRYYAAGMTYLEDLEDEDKALEVFEELITVDPEHVETGHRLVVIYQKRDNLPRAAAMLEMLTRKVDPKDKAAVLELNLRLGTLLEQLSEETDRPLAAYRAAYDVDPTDRQMLRRLAGLLFRREELEEAAKMYQALLVHRRAELTDEEAVEVFYKLGDIKERQGEQNKALNMYEKAMELDPSFEPVLRRAVVLYESKDNLDAVLRCKKRLLKGAKDDAQKLAVAEEIGDLLREKLKRPEEAIKHYFIARDIQPDHRRILNKIMEVYIEQRKWTDAIQAMGKIEDYEQSPMHRSRLHYTAAVIFRDELKQTDDAVHHFDQALLKDPSFRKAFDALKKLYTQQENYKALAKAYHVMLQRLPEDTPAVEQAQLWTELGDICQFHLADPGEAIVAYEVADKLDPADEVRKEHLARLYAGAGPEAFTRAVAVNQRRLKTNPMRLDAYRELRRLYTEAGQVDRAFCAAAVLAMLGKASDEELALYRTYRRDAPRQIQSLLTDSLWNTHLNHLKQNRTLSYALSVAAPVVAPMAVRAPQTYALKEKHRLQPDKDTRPYSLVAAYVGHVLGVAPDQMYLHAEAREPVSVVLVGDREERRTVLRLSPQVVKCASESELCYWFGRYFSLLRPEHFLHFVTGSATVLQAVALACLKLADPGARVEGDTAQIDKLTAALRDRLRPSALEFLSKRAADLRQVATLEAVEQWMVGVEHTVTRAALLLSDDLQTTARLVSVEPEITGLSVERRLADLLTFSVSDPYAELRAELGLKIE